MDDVNPNLLKLLTPLTQEQSSYKVYSSATYYPTFTRVYIPNEPYDKLLPGMHVLPANKYSSNNEVSAENLEDNLSRSLRRTIKTIKDIVFCNLFDTFATFTFKANRDDVGKCFSVINNWIKNELKRKGKFIYLLVPEFHKDGVSLHFHVLLGGYSGVLVKAINPKTGKNLIQGGRQVYTLPSYTSGFTNVKKIDDNPESRAKVGFYISKYITKDMPLLPNRNRYWASNKLILPLVQENPEPWYKEREPLKKIEVEHGTLLYFEPMPAVAVWAGEPISFYHGTIPEFIDTDSEKEK